MAPNLLSQKLSMVLLKSPPKLIFGPVLENLPWTRISTMEKTGKGYKLYSLIPYSKKSFAGLKSHTEITAGSVNSTIKITGGPM